MIQLIYKYAVCDDTCCLSNSDICELVAETAVSELYASSVAHPRAWQQMVENLILQKCVGTVKDHYCSLNACT